MNENIFREYDIRGIVDQDFSSDVIESIGKAFGTILNHKKFKNVSISGDVRHTTERLKNNLVKGLNKVGINVFDMGILPTPVNYFSLFTTPVVCSIQVTGSHNPSEYNGFKLSLNKKPFYGSEIQKLKNIIINKSFFISKTVGEYSEVNVMDRYIDYILDNINLNKKMKIAMDCGNAVGGVVAPTIFNKIGVDLKELYCDVDPDFPNHHPDPTVDKNLVDLCKMVKDEKCDFGVAYDGDADRIVAVDEKGNIVRSDILMSIFVNDIINKNESVVYDVKCSRALKETIVKNGGIPVMCKTGHSHIKNKIIETKSKLGGEMSGHIFFADKYFGFDDGIYVSARLAELLSKTNKKLSYLVSKIPSYMSTPEIRIDCNTDEDKIYISNQVIDYFISKYSCDTTDGVRIDFEGGWGLVRSSNTQPVIVCRFEADTQELLEKIQNIVITKIKEFGNIDVRI